MSNDEIIKKAEEFAIKAMSHYDSSHDWKHVMRVRKYARFINSQEKCADPFLLDMAAILHDVADSKFSEGDERYEILRKLFDECGLQYVSNKLLSVIRNVSYSSTCNETCDFPELYILQDADRLDAIGAIGIARAFSYGGFRNRPLYEPDFPGQPSTISHFYDKLIKLKDLMNTATGRKIAEERHKFIELFLAHFQAEWNYENDLYRTYGY